MTEGMLPIESAFDDQDVTNPATAMIEMCVSYLTVGEGETLNDRLATVLKMLMETCGMNKAQAMLATVAVRMLYQERGLDRVR